MEHISIWGAGEIGKRCCFALKDRYVIDIIYDNDSEKWGQKIFGIPVSKYDGKKQFIVIATIKYWREISTLLEEQGLIKNKDFMPYWLFNNIGSSFCRILKEYTEVEIKYFFENIKRNKKICLTFGNCQTVLIQKMLLFNPGFFEDYYVIDIPRICEYGQNSEMQIFENEDLWNNIDLFIYQKISVTNKFSKYMCTDNL